MHHPLLEMVTQPPEALTSVVATGVYAWWGTVAWPVGFPPVNTDLPLYIGKASDTTLAHRTRKQHLSRTRVSALRRSLAALLADDLDLRGEVYRDSRLWGLHRDGEARLTGWMLENLRVTWVVLDSPGTVETQLIRDLLPPLNDKDATGSPFRGPMRLLRTGLRDAAV